MMPDLAGIRNILKQKNMAIKSIVSSEGISSIEWLRQQESIENFLWGLEVAFESMDIPFECRQNEWGFIASVRVEGHELIEEGI